MQSARYSATLQSSIYASLGAIAQLGERLVCIQEVCGSIPHSSTIPKIIFMNEMVF